jgi:hypothetical protein
VDRFAARNVSRPALPADEPLALCIGGHRAARDLKFVQPFEVLYALRRLDLHEPDLGPFSDEPQYADMDFATRKNRLVLKGGEWREIDITPAIERIRHPRAPVD